MPIALVRVAWMMAAHLGGAVHVEGMGMHSVVPVASMVDPAGAHADVKGPARFADDRVRIPRREHIVRAYDNSGENQTDNKAYAAGATGASPRERIEIPTDLLDSSEIDRPFSRNIDLAGAIPVTDANGLRAARVVKALEPNDKPLPPTIPVADRAGPIGP
jgi:hypothetical protein